MASYEGCPKYANVTNDTSGKIKHRCAQEIIKLEAKHKAQLIAHNYHAKSTKAYIPHEP